MTEPRNRRLETVRRALSAPSSTTRLQAALAAGTDPDPALVGILIERCAHEPDFYVRDMLTWALTRHDRAQTVPAVLLELESAITQAHSQALHTLSKLGDSSAFTPVAMALMTDPDDEVARSAWRVAGVLASEHHVSEVAGILATQFGRGDAELHRSLSRAFVELGDAAMPAVRRGQSAADPMVRGHARATEALMLDPESAFAFDVEAARRQAALGPAAVVVDTP